MNEDGMNFFPDNSNTWPRQRFQPHSLVMDADSDEHQDLPQTAADAKSFFEAMFSIPSMTVASTSPSASMVSNTGKSGNTAASTMVNVENHMMNSSASTMHASNLHHHQVQLMQQQQQQQQRPISAPPARELLLNDESSAVSSNDLLPNSSYHGVDASHGVYRSHSVGMMHQGTTMSSSVSSATGQQQFTMIGLNQRRPNSTSAIAGLSQQFQQIQLQDLEQNRSLNFSPAPGSGTNMRTSSGAVNVPPGMTLQRPSSAFEGSSRHQQRTESNSTGFLLSSSSISGSESAMYSTVGSQLRRPASTGLIGMERATPKTIMDLIQEENSPSPSISSPYPNSITPQPVVSSNNTNQHGSEGVYQHFSEGPAPTVNGTRIQYVSAQTNQNNNQHQAQTYMNVYNSSPSVPIHHVVQHPHLQQPQQHQMQYIAAPSTSLYYDPASPPGDHHPIYVNTTQATVSPQYYTTVPFTSHLHMPGQPQQRLVAMGGHPEYTLVTLSSQQHQLGNGNIQAALPYWSDPNHATASHRQDAMAHSHSSGSLQQNLNQRQGNHLSHQDKGGNERNRYGGSSQGNLKGNSRGGNNGKRGGDANINKNSKFNILLEELGLNKTQPVKIEDIKGHIFEFCKDQNGSRFIQQRLEVSKDPNEKEMVMKEVGPRIRELRDDVFGNYVVQKLFEYKTKKIGDELTSTLYGEMRTLSRQMYGCRVLQTALESLDDTIVIKLVDEFRGHVVSCIHDQNGNHVIQKCVEVLSKKVTNGNEDAETKINFILDEVLENTTNLSCHPYGCRVLQRVLEHCPTVQRSRALDEISLCHSDLLDDQYGNYVVQHVLQYGRDSDRESILALVIKGGLLTLSRQKFASNVVEKLLQFGSPSQRNKVVVEMLKKHGNEHESVVLLMVRDAYANYVVQTTLDVVPEGNEKALLLKELNDHSDQLRQYTFAKHIVTKLGSGDAGPIYNE